MRCGANNGEIDMSNVTFKSMIKDGTIKRADAMKVKYEDLHIEPGFNGRIASPATKQDDEELFKHIMEGGPLPALEVRPREEGGVWIVEGHRRHKQYGRAIKEGAPLQSSDGEVWIEVVPFKGNDVDRTARIVTSNSQLKLTPLETAGVYKRLAAFKLSPEEIGEKVNKTRQHVEQMLILANANNDVHELVKSGVVSAAVAIEAVRKHGENAGKFLASKFQEVKSSGKSKVTAGDVKGKALPREIVSGLVVSVDAFMGSLSTTGRVILTEIENGTRDDPSVMVNGRELLKLIASHKEVQDAREKQAEKAREKAAKAAQSELLEGGAA